MYEIKDVPGKGKGVIATQDIPKGTRIMSERPILVALSTDPTFQERLPAMVAKLSKKHRAEFLSRNPGPTYPETDREKYFQIFRRTALPMDSQGQDALGGFFIDASRINHACDCNAACHWSISSKRKFVKSLRDIARGEEITIQYFVLKTGRPERRAMLLRNFGFLCTCNLCSLPDSESDCLDDKIRQINVLAGQIDRTQADKAYIQCPIKALRLIRRVMQLVRDAEFVRHDTVLPYFAAGSICCANGDMARSRAFFQLAVNETKAVYGDDYCDHPLARQLSALAKCPTLINNFGKGSEVNKWQTRLDDDASEHHTWRANALGFTDLPLGVVEDVEFYSAKDIDGLRHPIRSWCYVGEIECSLINNGQRCLLAKDEKGLSTLCAFYTKLRGAELDTSLFKGGNTIVVLYARQDQNAVGRPGLYIQDGDIVKIFPMPLNKALALGEDFTKYGPATDDNERASICHGCDNVAMKGDVLHKTCSGCRCYSYCSKDCQTTGWKAKNHKAVCKVLKNKDIKDLLTMNWGHYPGLQDGLWGS